MQTTTLTTESISKLFFRYLIPSICGTMVTSIYVLADAIVIGKGIGIEAIAALNISLPIFNLFFGTGLLFGVGGAVLMSICRGRGDSEMGETYFTISLLLNAVTCMIYTILFTVFLDEIATFLGATATTRTYMTDYVTYVVWGTSVFAFSSFLQVFVQNDGAPKLSMIAVISGGVLNVILDIIFVYPLQMGMSGASIASVLGSALTVCIMLTHFKSKSNGLHLRFDHISLPCIGSIFVNGFTSFLTNISMGIVTFFFNIQLLKYVGDIGVSVYGIIANTAIVVYCLCKGINQAAQPIISTNYGARLPKRITEIRKLGIRTALYCCAIPTLLGFIIPDLFTYIFINPTAQVLALSSLAIRIYFIGFAITGVNMFVIAYFQAITKVAHSLLLCLLRGCILSTLLVYLLPPILGVNGIWLAVPLAEFITLGISILLLKIEGIM